MVILDESDIKKKREIIKKSGGPKFVGDSNSDENEKTIQVPLAKKERKNLLEEDEETLRMKQEAIEVRKR